MFKYFKGKTVKLSQEEKEQLLEQQKLNEESEARESRLKLKRKSIPSERQLIESLLAQFNFMKKSRRIPLVPNLEKNLGDIINMEQEFSDIEDKEKFNIAEHASNQKDVNEERITELEQELIKVRQMADEAKASNKKIQKTLDELNSSLKSIQGFSMVIPEIRKNTIAIRESIDHTQSDDEQKDDAVSVQASASRIKK